MVNQQVMVGNWHKILGKLQKRWGILTDDDLDQFDGDANMLVGLIEKKTGETRETIENYLEDLAYETNAAVGRASKKARSFVRQASGAVQDSTQRAVDRARRAYIGTAVQVRHYPIQSLAVAFGVGMLAGVVVVIGLRGRGD